MLGMRFRRRLGNVYGAAHWSAGGLRRAAGRHSAGRRLAKAVLSAGLIGVALNASAASAVVVSLPTDAVINGSDTTVDMTIGSVTDLLGLAVSFTFDSAIVTVPAGGVTVPAGS